MNKVTTLLGTIIALMLFVSASVFTVQEYERGIMLRLGKMVGTDGKPTEFGPGLHFKLPFLDTVYLFDARLQTLEIQETTIVTVEKKHVIVDLFVKWRIDDFGKFFTSTNGNYSRAQKLLQEKIIDGVRAEFGRRTIREVVSGERREVMEQLSQEAEKNAQVLGIQVVDARVKRIDLPPEVSSNVFDRMRSERQRVAAEHRAEGQAKGEIIKAKADAKVTVILATAEQEATRLRGEGDAESSRIYANAYNKNPEFYRFIRSLEAYTETFKNKQDILVLEPDSDFFRYFNSPRRAQ
jgi:membrane protease subunit HflC